MATGNIVIGGLPNYVDGVTGGNGLVSRTDALVTPDPYLVKATSEVANLPATNLQSSQVSKPWRSLSRSPGDVGLRFGFSNNRANIGCVALSGHTFSPGSYMRAMATAENSVALTPGAVSFNGTTGYGRIAASGAFSTGSFTLEAWVRLDAVAGGTARGIMGCVNAAGIYFEWGLDAANGTLYFSNGGAINTSGKFPPVSVSPSGLVHFAVVLDRTAFSGLGGIYFYVQGRQVSAAMYSGFGGTCHTAGQDIWFGKSSAAAGFLDGCVSEVRIWKEARSQAQILTNMHSRLGTATGPEQPYANLFSCYRLDEGTGSTATDYGSAANNATLNGGFVWEACPSYLKLPTLAIPNYDSGWVAMWPGGPDSWNPNGTIAHIFSTPVAFARHVWIDFYDPNVFYNGNAGGYSNLPNYVDVGRAIIGPVFSPASNAIYGLELNYADDNTKISKSRGGQTWTEARDRYRVVSFGLDNMSDAEALQSALLLLQRDKGTAADMLLSLFPADATYGQATSMQVRQKELLALVKNNPDAWEGSFSFEELL